MLFWIAGLLVLFVMNPLEQHFTLCPLNNLGFDYCPGCGVGRSIHFAMRFDFTASFAAHPVGILALVVIVYRIIKLIINPLKNMNNE